MKKLSSIVIIMIALFSLSACQKVPAGFVGVKVYLLGGAKGVDIEELGVGRYWVGVNEEIYTFPVFQQNVTWTKNISEGNPVDESFTFQTKEGMEVSADIGMSYSIDPKKVTTLFQTYRKGIEEITDIYMRNHVRDAINQIASTMPVESVYGEGKAKLITDVQKIVSDKVAPIGIKVDKIYLIGTFRLPAPVLAALNSKIEATQKAQQLENEIRGKEAEAKKLVAEAQGKAEARMKEAKAEADSNRMITESITTTLVEYMKVQKWSGNLPQVTGNSTPIVDLRVK